MKCHQAFLLGSFISCLIVGFFLAIIGCNETFGCPLYRVYNGTIINSKVIQFNYSDVTLKYDGGTCVKQVLNVTRYSVNQTMNVYVRITDGYCNVGGIESNTAIIGFSFYIIGIVLFIAFLCSILECSFPYDIRSLFRNTK